MNDYVIEIYDTFNTKGFSDELIFIDFHDRPIPPDYYDLLNDDDDDSNNTPGTPVDDVLLDNEGVEDAFVSNSPNTDGND